MIDWQAEVNAIPAHVEAYRCSGCKSPLALGQTDIGMVAICFDCNRYFPISFEVKDANGNTIGRAS